MHHLAARILLDLWRQWSDFKIGFKRGSVKGKTESKSISLLSKLILLLVNLNIVNIIS